MYILLCENDPQHLAAGHIGLNDAFNDALCAPTAYWCIVYCTVGVRIRSDTNRSHPDTLTDIGSCRHHSRLRWRELRDLDHL